MLFAEITEGYEVIFMRSDKKDTKCSATKGRVNNQLAKDWENSTINLCWVTT